MLSETGSLQDISGLTDVDTIDQIAWSSDNQLAIRYDRGCSGRHLAIWDGTTLIHSETDMGTFLSRGMSWRSDNQLAMSHLAPIDGQLGSALSMWDGHAVTTIYSEKVEGAFLLPVGWSLDNHLAVVRWDQNNPQQAADVLVLKEIVSRLYNFSKQTIFVDVGDGVVETIPAGSNSKAHPVSRTTSYQVIEK